MSLLINQIQRENEKMKEFLKSKGFKENEGLMSSLITKIKNKKGFIKIDAKLLIAIVLVFLIYLIYKAYFS